MAKVDREPIGTMPCEHCGGVRSIHETGKGPRKGLLYTRCPSCTETKTKCIQKVDSAYQAEIRSKATWREGFERYGEPLQPPAVVNENPETPVNTKGTEEPETPKPKTETPKARPNRSGLTLVAALAGTFLIIVGAITS